MRPYILFLCVFFITCPPAIAEPNTSQVNEKAIDEKTEQEKIARLKEITHLEEIKYKASYGKNWKKELEADKQRSEEARQYDIKRRDEYIILRPDLPQTIKDAILNKHIIIGMDAEAVSLAIGSPDNKLKTIAANNTSEQWIYNNRYYVYFVNDIVTIIQEMH